MTLVLPLKTIRDGDRERVSGKAFSLARMAQSGMKVPDTLCVTTDAYMRFVKESGLRERISMELNRKAFKDMRWEEMWDTALRIRNMFLNTRLSRELGRILRDAVASVFMECTQGRYAHPWGHHRPGVRLALRDRGPGSYPTYKDRG